VLKKRDVVGEMFSMCEFKFLDMTPQDVIKILEYDIKQHQKKIDYHTEIANSYKAIIEELEVKVGKLQQKIRKEKENDI